MVGWLINYLSIACSIKLQSHITCFEGMKCPGAPNDLMCFREETPHLSFLLFKRPYHHHFKGLSRASKHQYSLVIIILINYSLLIIILPLLSIFIYFIIFFSFFIPIITIIIFEHILLFLLFSFLNNYSFYIF